jgi:beta-fructofuranosidase
MNDPNGLIFWNGRYHMFYQCNPVSTAHSNICWGHAASEDLLHWEDLPLALTPSEGSADEDGCWSGCAVVNDGSVYILYTGVQGQRPHHRQRPCLARAIDDDLVSFEKFAGNPVISEEPIPGLFGFRDHTVRRVNGEFRQLIGSGSAALGGCVLEYRSTDLLSWEYSGVFLAGKSADLPGVMWECPDFFQLGDRWFLVTSLFDRAPGRVMAVQGTFEGERFVPMASGQLDLGNRWYAPQSFDAPGGRRLSFGWLREREDELPADARGRVGVMSLPRQLIVGTDGSLGMAPAAELMGLRGTPLALAPEIGPHGALVLESAHPLAACEVEVTGGSASTVFVDLLDEHDRPVLRVCSNADDIEIGASLAPLSTSRVPLPGTVRIFYDGGICEVFSATGRVRTEIFYDRPPVRRVATWGTPAGDSTGETRPVAARAWEHDNIWDGGGLAEDSHDSVSGETGRQGRPLTLGPRQR